MKVVLASTSSGSRGGGELFLLYLGRGLKALGCEPVLWASEHGRMDDLCRRFEEVGQVVRAPLRNTYDEPLRSLAGAWAGRGRLERIAESLAGLGGDVIHVNKQNLEDGLDLVRATSLVACPAVCTIHLTQTERELGARFGGMRDWVARRVLEGFRGPLVAVSEVRREALARFLPGARTEWVANGISLPERRAEVREGRLCVVAVGRVVPQKRPELFLEGALEIRARCPEARFVWVGGGVGEEALRRAVVERGLAGVVTVTGWVESAEPWLAEADLLLHPARYEGLPFALLEGMAWGVPAVVAPEVWEGLPDDLGEVTIRWPERGLGDLVRDENRWRGMGERGRELVGREYSERGMASRYLELYRSVR